jgi:hypothetical protein
VRNHPYSGLVALCAAGLAVLLTGANYRTENFTVSANSATVAKSVGDWAEHLRLTLAIDWLGEELPRWSQPCPIRVDDGPELAPTGRTSFVFRRGEAGGWEMSLVGPVRTVIDNVLPHEVMHTILATHFGRPLPRWADEGTCTIVEHPEELQRHRRLVAKLLQREATFSLIRLFEMDEYPRDPIPFYMQSYSVSSFLINRGGRQQFIRFLDDATRSRDWSTAVKMHYGLEGLAALESAWMQAARAESGLIADEATFADSR